MKSKILKGILGLALLTISPFFMLAIVCILYVAFQMIGGASFTAGVQTFIDLIYSLLPYFSYLTAIPVIMVIAILIYKNKQFILSKLTRH
ncbi:MAG: hypothetical protein CVU91_11930 [Firmicutes bacterium HGW-Firmicutes-16]|nr:MAG: hypothetical protein CVU91_11930 [Firmicutes bacterium HGW-Firmicutes-16]